MSDLQARLAKLRASNQAIKAVAERIESAKVLGSAALDELDEFIEEEAPEPQPEVIQAESLELVAESVDEPVSELIEEQDEQLAQAVEEDEAEPVFVKDVAPQVAGALPEILDSEELPEKDAPQQNEELHDTLKVRREGGA